MKPIRKQSSIWKILGYVLGFRVVEEEEHYIVFRFPFWIPKESLHKATSGIATDAKLFGRDLKVTVGDRYVRVEDVL